MKKILLPVLACFCLFFAANAQTPQLPNVNLPQVPSVNTPQLPSLKKPKLPSLKTKTPKADAKLLEDEVSFKDRLFLAGDLGGNVSPNQIQVLVSPQLGYRYNERFSLGLGPVFTYNRVQSMSLNPFTGLEYKVSSTQMMYGARSFARFTLIKGFYVESDGELLNSEIEGRRQWTPVFWAGGGYNFKVAGRLSFNMTFLYNPVFNKDKGPYVSPFDFRVGFQL